MRYSRSLLLWELDMSVQMYSTSDVTKDLQCVPVAGKDVRVARRLNPMVSMI